MQPLFDTVHRNVPLGRDIQFYEEFSLVARIRFKQLGLGCYVEVIQSRAWWRATGSAPAGM